MYCNYNKISDNYYSAYKEELMMKETHKRFYFLNTIIKALFILLSLILTILISIYIMNNISNTNILESIFQEKKPTILTTPIQIREDLTQLTLEETIKTNVPNLNMNEKELALLIELIKSQITVSTQAIKPNNPTISTNI